MHAEVEADEKLDEDLLSLWRRLASEDPDSPDRFELTELGEVVLSPRPTGRHQKIVLAVIGQLQAQEVALIAVGGKVTFYRLDGPHPESALGVKLALAPELFR